MPPTIMIIDDDAAMRHIIETILTRKNFHVLNAHSVEAAFDILEKHTPDVICCDLMMPEESGIDFLMKRRNLAHLADIPVIVISATSETRIITEALSLGAFAHLPKPMSSTNLMETINAALEAQKG